MGREVGRGLRWEWTQVCLWLIHVDMWQKKKITMLSSNYPPIKLINFLKSHLRFASMDLAS